MHLDDLEHKFDEDDMFALGGILLPPYPKNFFKHPLLDDSYEYQNGALWHWFGARLIYAMFQQGFSQTATEKWLEIIKKNVDNRGFFEWDNKEGIGRGSDYYAGTAGSMGKALFEGYFGVNLKWNALSIEPKLDKESARIHIFQPANDTLVAYEYSFNETKNMITLGFNSNFPHKGKLKILNPWPELIKDVKDMDRKLDVLFDGNKRSYRTEMKNQDVFLVFETDFNNHSVEILTSKTTLTSNK